jgi:8-oxo-dGTP pyrophosphatase MutT (NUDIX family)
MLGAGMVIIQPSTHKIVVIYETEKQYWFLPRGRKDVGESLEQAALREAYEESGYRAEFLPLLNPTHQPVPPGNRANSDWLNTEPIYMTLTSWQPRKRRNGTIGAYGGEYVTMWYVGQIPEDMTPDEGTGMADEQNYQSYLLTVEEAMSRLWDSEKLVVAYTWRIFLNTELEKSKMATESGAGTSAGQGLL